MRTALLAAALLSGAAPALAQTVPVGAGTTSIASINVAPAATGVTTQQAFAVPQSSIANPGGLSLGGSSATAGAFPTISGQTGGIVNAGGLSFGSGISVGRISSGNGFATGTGLAIGATGGLGLSATGIGGSSSTLGGSGSGGSALGGLGASGNSSFTGVLGTARGFSSAGGISAAGVGAVGAGGYVGSTFNTLTTPGLGSVTAGIAGTGTTARAGIPTLQAGGGGGGGGSGAGISTGSAADRITPQPVATGGGGGGGGAGLVGAAASNDPCGLGVAAGCD